jgi:serine/threonine-protein kinase
VTREVIGDRYRLDERIGLGGMGEVWSAQDLKLDRRVAIKLLGPQADPARFDREARAIAALAHPNICRLYDYGRSDGRRYMVLEYLPGGTLEDRMRTGDPLADEDTARISGELASGLAQAHAQGLVHRDLKPANVLFDDEGRAKIADFGIAHFGEGATLTEAGTMLGTAAYISPEQASGEPAGPPSDVYSFGVILFRMLTGQLPFEGTHPLELAAKHVSEPPPAIETLRPDAPPLLAGIATAALMKDPAARPPDGKALVEALAGAPTAVTAPIGEARTEVIPRATRRPPAQRRSPWLVPLLAVAGLLALAGVALAVLMTGTQATSDTTSSRSSSEKSSTELLSSSTTPSSTTTASSSTSASTSTTSTSTTTPTLPGPPPQPPPKPPPPPTSTSTTTPTSTTTSTTLPLPTTTTIP